MKPSEEEGRETKLLQRPLLPGMIKEKRTAIMGLRVRHNTPANALEDATHIAKGGCVRQGEVYFFLSLRSLHELENWKSGQENKEFSYTFNLPSLAKQDDPVWFRIWNRALSSNTHAFHLESLVNVNSVPFPSSIPHSPEEQLACVQFLWEAFEPGVFKRQLEALYTPQGLAYRGSHFSLASMRGQVAAIQLQIPQCQLAVGMSEDHYPFLQIADRTQRVSPQQVCISWKKPERPNLAATDVAIPADAAPSPASPNLAAAGAAILEQVAEKPEETPASPPSRQKKHKKKKKKKKNKTRVITNECIDSDDDSDVLPDSSARADETLALPSQDAAAQQPVATHIEDAANAYQDEPSPPNDTSGDAAQPPSAVHQEAAADAPPPPTERPLAAPISDKNQQDAVAPISVISTEPKPSATQVAAAAAPITLVVHAPNTQPAPIAMQQPSGPPQPQGYGAPAPAYPMPYAYPQWQQGPWIPQQQGYGAPPFYPPPMFQGGDPQWQQGPWIPQPQGYGAPPPFYPPYPPQWQQDYLPPQYQQDYDAPAPFYHMPYAYPQWQQDYLPPQPQNYEAQQQPFRGRSSALAGARREKGR